MKRYQNEKGFTMVELLAVMVILAVLSTIAVVATSSVHKKMEQVYYQAQIKLIQLAGEDYYSDHRELLPVEANKKSEVSLETLVSEKYMDPIYSYDKELCTEVSPFSTKVIVTREDSGKYHYQVLFSCGDYTQE